MKCYKIADWDLLYENAQTTSTATLTWIKLQNRFDDPAWFRLVSHPAIKSGDEETGGMFGLAVYAVFVAACQIVGKLVHRNCRKVKANGRYHRPWLVSQTGDPVGAGEISMILRLPLAADTIQRALDALVACGWLTLEEMPEPLEVLPPGSAPETLFEVQAPSVGIDAVAGANRHDPAELRYVPDQDDTRRQPTGVAPIERGSNALERGSNALERGSNALEQRDRTGPIEPPKRIQQTGTGTGAMEPRSDHRTGSDRAPFRRQLRRRGPEREAELLNLFKQTDQTELPDGGGNRFLLMFVEAAEGIAYENGYPADDDEKRNLVWIAQKLQGNPRRAEIAASIVYTLVEKMEWARKRGEGNPPGPGNLATNPWAIWQTRVNKILKEAKVA